MNLVLSPISKAMEKANRASYQAIWEGIKNEIIDGTHRVLAVEFTEKEWDEGMKDVIMTDKFWYCSLQYPTSFNVNQQKHTTTVGHWMNVPVKVLYPL